MSEQASLCPLCGRVLAGEVQDHHLVPHSLKGKDVVSLHKICHVTIHSTLTERELQHEYNTIELLQGHEVIQKFIRWIKKNKKNEPEYYSHTKDTRSRYNKRANRKRNKKL